MRRVVKIAMVLAVLVAVSGAGVAGTAGAGGAARVRVRLRVSAECDPAGFVSQSIDGRVTGCLRLGNLRPGLHAVALQDLLVFLGPRRPRPPKQPAPAQPFVRLTLSPASGPPGTLVTVTGRLRRPIGPHDSHPNICWDGCGGGFGYGDVTMHWTSATTFRTSIVVPAAPWIAGPPARLIPLVSGDYPVAITCLRQGVDCGVAPGPAALFHLEVSRPVAWCTTVAACAPLRVVPARAQPGDIVRVTGFAPLVEGNLSTTGAGYGAVVVRRRRHERQVRFATQNGTVTATVGDGALRVAPAPAYHAVTPLGRVTDAVPQIASDPVDPGTIAWCDGQTIAITGPDGTTPVPSATAKPVLQGMGFSFRFDAIPECAAVAPLATSGGAPSGLVAAFTVTESEGPPFYLAALVTHDDGRTWAPIPVPTGSGPAGFGGVRYRVDGTLQAVFAVSEKSPIKGLPEFNLSRAVTEVSSADGQSWSQAPLTCPVAGPCVNLAPYQPGNCAMNGTTQLLLRSSDGGRRWSAPDFPYAVQSCDQAALVATSPSSALLVASASDYPVLRTTDGGRSWHDLAIPRPPGQGNLTVLGDGSLLQTARVGDQGRWSWLRRGTDRWCRVRIPAIGVQRRLALSQVTVIADALWWLTGSVATPDAAPALNRLPLSALSC